MAGRYARLHEISICPLAVTKRNVCPIGVRIHWTICALHAGRPLHAASDAIASVSSQNTLRKHTPTRAMPKTVPASEKSDRRNCLTPEALGRRSDSVLKYAGDGEMGKRM